MDGPIKKNSNDEEGKNEERELSFDYDEKFMISLQFEKRYLSIDVCNKKIQRSEINSKDFFSSFSFSSLSFFFYYFFCAPTDFMLTRKKMLEDNYKYSYL